VPYMKSIKMRCALYVCYWFGEGIYIGSVITYGIFKKLLLINVRKKIAFKDVFLDL
jgi:hypothetical protein